MSCDGICVHVLSKTGRIILASKVSRISRFGVIQDYTIHLEGGQEVMLMHRAVDLIAKEWIKQHRTETLAVLDAREEVSREIQY